MRKSPFTQTWQKFFPNPLIPYDREQRRERFPEAYQSLAEYIEKWEGIRELGPRKMYSLFHRRPDINELL